MRARAGGAGGRRHAAGGEEAAGDGSEVAYNQRAAAVMARHHIPVNDLHAYLSKQIAPLKARIPDVFALPKSFLFHEPMLEAIKPQLGKQ